MFWNGTIYRHRNCWENSWTLYENPVHIESYPELDTPAQAHANTLFAGIPHTIGQQQKLSKEDASFDSVFGADFAEKASTRSAPSVGLDCQSPKQPDRFKCLSNMDVDDYNMLSLDSGQFDRSSSSRDTSLASLPESEDGSYDDAGEDSPRGKPGDDATEDSLGGKPDETETYAGRKMAWSGNKHDGLFSGSRSRDVLCQKPTSGKDLIKLASTEDFESSPDSNDSGIHDNITYTPSYQPPLEHGVIHANITHPRSYQRSPLEDGGYLHGINRSRQITKTLDNKRVVNDIENNNNDNDDRCNDNIDNCATTTTADYADDLFSIPHLKSFSEYPSESNYPYPPMNTFHESSRPLLETGGTGNDDQPWSRFTVRSLGWIRLTDGELTSDPGSRSALKKKIAKLSLGRNDFSDVVGRWGDGSSLCLELDDEGIALCDSQNLTVFTVQPIYAVCVWGVGRNHGSERDFAYVARDSSTLQNVCHVFRCDGGQARDIANALECICEKLHERRACLKQRIETNAPDEWAWPKDNEWAWSDGLSETKATRPSDLPNLERIEMYPHHKQSSIPIDSYQDATLSEHSRTLRCYYLGSEQVSNPKDAETLDDAMNKVYSRVSKDKWISVNVDIRPSTLIVTDSEFPDKILARCPVRYLSCMGISTSNMCLCSFIIHGPEDQLVAHIFHSRPYAGVLCKAIEKACKLQHQRNTDQVQNGKRWSNILFPWIYPTTATSFAPQTL